MRYLEQTSTNNIKGAILASGPSEKNDNSKIDSFLEAPFDFAKIKATTEKFCIIQGDNDPLVPMSNAEFYHSRLECSLVIVPNGGHLNGSAGWLTLPQALEALQTMFIEPSGN